MNNGNQIKYDTVKKDCKEFRKTKENKKELYDYFKNLNIEQKLKKLGKMDCSNINENSNFIPIIDVISIYFSKYINKIFTVKGEISNGIIFIYEPKKKSENNLILLYKDKNESNEFNKVIITLEQNVRIRNMVKELKGKNIEEIIDLQSDKIQTIHIIYNNSNKNNNKTINRNDDSEINITKNIFEEEEGEDEEEEEEEDDNEEEDEEDDSDDIEKLIKKLDEKIRNINKNNKKNINENNERKMLDEEEKKIKEEDKRESKKEEIKNIEQEHNKIIKGNMEMKKIEEMNEKWKKRR